MGINSDPSSFPDSETPALQKLHYAALGDAALALEIESNLIDVDLLFSNLDAVRRLLFLVINHEGFSREIQGDPVLLESILELQEKYGNSMN